MMGKKTVTVREAARVVLSRWYVVAGLAWFIRFATLGHIPFLQEPPLWANWFDQSRYLASAQALARGDLSAHAHWYPLGYALAAAPFVWLVPSNPFFLLDPILFLLTCHAFQRVASRLDVGEWTATWCFLATTVVQTGLASAWAQPWTTTLSAALIWWLIDRVLTLIERLPDREQGCAVDLVVIGALSVALPLVRPVDALLSITCLVIVGSALLLRKRFTLENVLSLGLAATVIAGLYATLHLTIYGPHPTPYMVGAADTGFIWADLGWKAYILLIDPRPWYPGSKAILEVLPWIVPGLAGLIGAILIGTRRERWIIVLLLVLMLPVSTIMLTYADLQPPGLWFYGNVHYFKWVMPAFGLGILLCWRLMRTIRGRIILFPFFMMCLAPIGIRVNPVAVTDRQGARMLFFTGDAHRDYSEAYFAPVKITDSRGSLRNVNDFHQIPDTAGERAVAISRLFAEHPRRFDPGEPIFRMGQRPYARFGARISFLGIGL